MLPFSANWRIGGEKDLAAGLARLHRVEGAVCWDFGAHFGIHTVGMAMQVGASGQVVGFEPDPVAFARLERHVRMNRLANVRLYRAAASDENGEGQLVLHHGAGSTFSHFRYEDEPENPCTVKIGVVKVRPDTLCATGEIRRPDLIKVDIQGHGARALGGCVESIRLSRPVIVLSLHGNSEAIGVRDLLEPEGYTPHDLEGSALEWNRSDCDRLLLLAVRRAEEKT